MKNRLIHPLSFDHVTAMQHQDLPQLHGEEGAQAAHSLGGGPLRGPLHRYDDDGVFWRCLLGMGMGTHRGP